MIIKVLFSALLIIIFKECESADQFESAPPEGVDKEAVYYQRWSGGAAGSGGGIYLFIPVTKGVNYTLDSAYFQNRRVKLEPKQNDNNLLYVGKINWQDKRQADFVMHADPKKEAANKPIETVTVKTPFPFKLANNEAVISFTQNGQVRLFKLTDIEEKENVKSPIFSL